jgi:hypothetical protein
MLNLTRNMFGPMTPHNQRYHDSLKVFIIQRYPSSNLLSNYTGCNDPIAVDCGSGHIWGTNPHSIKHNKWCPSCYYLATNNIIADYRRLAESRGGTYRSDIIPANVDTPTDGWLCKDGHSWNACFSNIQRRTWCPACYFYTLEDYCKLAESRGGMYRLDTIPKNYGTPGDGWVCQCGNSWSASFSSIKQGSWCPICNESHLERSTRLFLIKYQIKFYREYTHPTLAGRRYDFWLIYDKRVYLTELDGRQHFFETPYFHRTMTSFAESKERDKQKSQHCIDNNIQLIRIPYQLINEIEACFRCILEIGDASNTSTHGDIIYRNGPLLFFNYGGIYDEHISLLVNKA